MAGLIGSLTRIATFAGVGLSVGALAACSGTSAGEASFALPEKNESQWLLPLDEYQLPLVDAVEDAQQLIVRSCMAERGLPWDVVLNQTGSVQQESWNPVGRKLFSPYLAERYGYGNSPMLDQAQARMDAENSKRKVAAGNSQLVDECFVRSDAVLGVTDGSAYDLAQQLQNLASMDAEASTAVRDAAGAWRECMADIGLPDLPDIPEEMPPASIGNGDEGPAIDAPRRSGDELDVPADVRRLAIKDAECRESTEYTTTLYDAEWDAQVEAMGPRLDDLERFKQQAAEQRALAERYLAENAVSQ